MDSGLRGQDLKILDFVAGNAERGHYSNIRVSCKLDNDCVVFRYQRYNESKDSVISTTLKLRQGDSLSRAALGSIRDLVAHFSFLSLHWSSANKVTCITILQHQTLCDLVHICNMTLQ